MLDYDLTHIYHTKSAAVFNSNGSKLNGITTLQTPSIEKYSHRNELPLTPYCYRYEDELENKMNNEINLKEVKKRIYISTPEFANKLCEICTPYTKEFDIDIVRGRCVLDASSILGIVSMLGKDVDIIPHTNNNALIKELFHKIDVI